MKHKLVFNSLTVLALFLAMCATAEASNTWYVDGVNGSDNNDCKTPQTACKTIGHAISLASSGDSIMVAAATYTENLTISISLKVMGAGASTTIIDGGAVNTVVGILTGGDVTVSKMTVRNGRAGHGGGIFNEGTLTINSSTVSGNVAVNTCTPKPCGGSGGGIFNEGTLTINSSTVSGNIAIAYCGFPYTCGGGGGGIANISGLMTINKSTVSGNSAIGQTPGGGGIANDGPMLLNNSTVNGNSAHANGTRGEALGGGIANTNTLAINNSTVGENSWSSHSLGGGGGIFNNQGAVTALQNSIVADNSPDDCSGHMRSRGYNLSSGGSCKFNKTGDMNNTDPMLGPLQNNGGPTLTQSLLSGSPAIDAGNPKGCTDGHGHLLKTDQRGKPRPDKEDDGIGCDMGAYERQKD